MAKKFYAVKEGRKSNVIVETWPKCQELTDGFKNAKYCGFNTLEDAQAYLLADKPKVADKGSKAHITVYCEATCEYASNGRCTSRKVKIDKNGQCKNY